MLIKQINALFNLVNKSLLCSVGVTIAYLGGFEEKGGAGVPRIGNIQPYYVATSAKD